ncbi:class I SAM-dependent methyltransferase [Paraglaciecola aquimarina]|uniref:Class I SAM-dependent methyltransferase n=1 Tax=Paraglaciecola algarum TaxID=3050085 RepID=A0ABS9D4P7_9ALTE|nr:class I SAM-dependent methyltransferase [Paraglaciecola sp. G1-23]MCF2946676.1 class I SAM-dependent methyltransferase [Paraglaciecola sp. G1-23]
MATNALYTDLSDYYDLMCIDIDYLSQSKCIQRFHQLFGSNGKTHLDLACGTGPHMRHFIDLGYQSSGLDINQPMLDLAQTRCPEADFSLQDMSDFTVSAPLDLVTCFLYSLHYNQNIEKIQSCIKSVYEALANNGVFCFNLVDKTKIDNTLFVKHTTQQQGNKFTFSSAWQYSGEGDKQSLKIRIEKETGFQTQVWQDEHSMVALQFDMLITLLSPYFDVNVFEHDYEKIMPYTSHSGNAIFVCVKI